MIFYDDNLARDFPSIILFHIFFNFRINPFKLLVQDLNEPTVRKYRNLKEKKKEQKLQTGIYYIYQKEKLNHYLESNKGEGTNAYFNCFSRTSYFPP